MGICKIIWLFIFVIEVEFFWVIFCDYLIFIGILNRMFIVILGLFIEEKRNIGFFIGLLKVNVLLLILVFWIIGFIGGIL